MRLITYSDNDNPRVGAVVDGRVADLGDRFDSMLTLIEEGNPEEVRSLAESG